MFRRAVAALSVLAASGAAAQTTSPPAPDKSGYTLFDPTPDDQLRSFCTDRPTRSNAPCTVDAGHFQYEADLVNWTYAHADGVTTNTVLAPNPTVKLGLTNTIDFEIAMAPWEMVTISGAAGKQHLTGIGDMFFRAKINLAGAEGGDFQAAIIPYVKTPLAKSGIGNGATEGGAIAPVSFALSSTLTLLFDPEIDILRNANDYGRHENYQLLANLTYTFSDTVSGEAEIWGQANDDPAGPTKQASVDFAVQWLAHASHPELQLDLGINVGLTPSTPKAQPYIGISQRF
jgi:hypothetical protein